MRKKIFKNSYFSLTLKLLEKKKIVVKNMALTKGCYKNNFAGGRFDALQQTWKHFKKKSGGLLGRGGEKN